MKNHQLDKNEVDHANACFLTTATVGALGLPDDCEPLTLARFLRDEKMTSNKEQAAVDLYYKVAPEIVARSSKDEWLVFWSRHMRKITALVKDGEYQLAKDLYTYATATLINKKVTRYADVEIVNRVYDYGLHGIGKQWLPYAVRYGLLKCALVVGLSYQAVRLGLAKRRFSRLLRI